MLELEEARQRIVETTALLPDENVPLAAAHGRCLAQPIVSSIHLPPFDNSAMDGFAVRAAEVASARAGAPVRLRICGELAAGEGWPRERTVPAGSCVRVFTGSPLPAGADAVVMQEDTRLETAAPGEILVLDAAQPWENVRLQGEDVKAGQPILRAGDRLTAGRIGILAAIGLREVQVRRQPVVAFLSTGHELVEAGGALAPGQIFESNRSLLSALVGASANVRATYPIVPDDPELTRQALTRAFNEADVVITSGGVCVGGKDFVKQAFADMGGIAEFWRVAIKPGKPFMYGRRDAKPLFGLPGNPVSAAVTFLLLVRPALWACQGASEIVPETGSCVLGEDLANHGDRTHFVRVRINTHGEAFSAGTQASHMLSSLAEADGLVAVPPRETLRMNSLVPTIRFG